MSQTELKPVVVDQIRSNLIDTAVRFLQNAKVSNESFDKKRSFLQKKGLTENEIDYALKLTQEKVQPKIEQTSFLRRLFLDLVIAGLFSYALKMIQRYFRLWNPNNKTNQLNETIANLQKTVQEIQCSIRQLEHTAEQLHLASLTGRHSSLAIDELKREIQVLKELSLSRSRFPPIPPQIPSWQLQDAEKAKMQLTSNTTESNTKTDHDDNKEESDGIVVINNNEKNSDDEHRLSSSASSESAIEAELPQ